MPQLDLTDEERDAILTGLRVLQIRLGKGDLPWDLHDIYTNCDSHEGLSVDDIDYLCEKVNV